MSTAVCLSYRTPSAFAVCNNSAQVLLGSQGMSTENSSAGSSFTILSAFVTVLRLAARNPSKFLIRSRCRHVSSIRAS